VSEDKEPKVENDLDKGPDFDKKVLDNKALQAEIKTLAAKQNRSLSEGNLLMDKLLLSMGLVSDPKK